MNHNRLFFTVLLVASATSVFSQTLKEALDKKDTVAALQLIKSGGNVNAVDENGTSPLMNACRWADAPMVHFLLAHGASADNPKSPKGRTPLMVACAYYGGTGIVGMLIGKGADVNAVAKGNITALMLAAQNAKLDVVELLLKKGANPKAKDAAGKTAYDYADKAEVSEYLKNSVKDTRLDKNGVMIALQKAMQ